MIVFSFPPILEWNPPAAEGLIGICILEGKIFKRNKPEGMNEGMKARQRESRREVPQKGESLPLLHLSLSPLSLFLSVPVYPAHVSCLILSVFFFFFLIITLY